MGRLHNPHKGIAGSSLPYSRTAPKWLKATPEEVVDQIYKFARKGMTPSQIGIVLRDSYGIAQVKQVTGNKIVRILRTQNLAPEYPEDLHHLMKKAVAIHKHLALNRKDMDAKFRMLLIEARIHRLVRYYIRAGQLAPTFKYEADKASAIVG
ncbi:ribosomal 40S subunit protein S13 [Cystobasidiomycetes sp. EMM_F5]